MDAQPVAAAPAGVRRLCHEQHHRAANSPLNRICTLLTKVAVHDIAVLIEGESGVGKELLARALHCASHRAQRPFVGENWRGAA